MPKWETKQCGVTRGRCASCGEEAELRLTESSFKRGWKDVFDSAFDARVDRRVSCSACRRTYPVRAADRTAAASTTRTGAAAPAGTRRRADDGAREQVAAVRPYGRRARDTADGRRASDPVDGRRAGNAGAVAPDPRPEAPAVGAERAGQQVPHST